MEPKGSLPCSEQPTSCPSCVPHESNYCTPFLFLSSVSVFSLYSKWCVSVRFPHQNASLLSHVCHMTCQLTPSLFDQPNNIWWGTQIVKLLIMQSSPVPCSLVSLRFRYLQHHVVKHSQCMFFPQCKIWSFMPTYSSRQNYISVYFIFIFLDNKWEDKAFWTEW